MCVKLGNTNKIIFAKFRCAVLCCAVLCCVVSASNMVVMVCLQAALLVLWFSNIYPLSHLKATQYCSSILPPTNWTVTVALVCLSYLHFFGNTNSEKKFIISSHSD